MSDSDTPKEAEPEKRGRGRPVGDQNKIQVTLRLDADVIEHFRSTGRGWQTRINETLRKAVKL